jgi:hypothetical protein
MCCYGHFGQECLFSVDKAFPDFAILACGKGGQKSAGGRTRTGTTIFHRGIFLPATAFAASAVILRGAAVDHAQPVH